MERTMAVKHVLLAGIGGAIALYVFLRMGKEKKQGAKALREKLLKRAGKKEEEPTAAPTQAVSTKVVKKKAAAKTPIYRMWVDPTTKSATFDILDKVMKQRIV
eukprot:CAMPEP_0118923638 /NCGR_PEP_ID=MMETSP1169-20130426/2088_1 /TAXON_ID=36882 /ORGANISM="Pyramimonas obovata, Strain CCMP722" /LENGTH=102 /DNA_ID=CAMNT_0006864653 /DNA_START=77 /DNA_END=382 /DNA_ORIENTATION=+